MGFMNDAIDAGTPLYEQLKSTADPTALIATWDKHDLLNVMAAAQSEQDGETYRVIYSQAENDAIQDCGDGDTEEI